MKRIILFSSLLLGIAGLNGWYYTTQYESRIPVVIMDSGINPKLLSNPKAMCKTGHMGEKPFVDPIMHGTNVANAVLKHMNADKYCIISATVTEGRFISRTVVKKILDELIDRNDTILINMSFGGMAWSPSYWERVNVLLDQGTHFTVASGNSRVRLTKEICNYYPACTRLWVNKPEYFHVVGSYTRSPFSKKVYSNYGRDVVSEWENGNIGPHSGTSFAVGVWAGKLLR